MPPPSRTCCCTPFGRLGASPGGWLSGPRVTIDPRVAPGTLVFPVAWLVFTLVGGAAIGFWPHPLLGADDFGFGVPLSA